MHEKLPCQTNKKTAGAFSAKARAKKSRHLPPGQRLICYLALALTIVFIQALANRTDTAQSQSPPVNIQVKPDAPFRLTENFTKLDELLRTESDKPKLHAGIFAVDPDTGRYVDIDGHQPFSAASIIKIPVIVALLVEMDQGKIKPSDTLTIRQDLIGSGSGILQWRPVGTRMTVAEVTQLMIKISDNTATNMIIDRIGGIQQVNQMLSEMNLTQTRINNWLPDLDGTNKTSPYELTYLLAKVDQGEIISPEARNWMYQLMEHVKTKTLLPVGLGEGATIAHKTGDIGSMVGDAGIVHSADGKRYFVAMQVERPHNDLRANHMIRHLSRLVYSGFVDGNCDNVSFADIDSKYAAPQVAHHRRGGIHRTQVAHTQSGRSKTVAHVNSHSSRYKIIAHATAHSSHYKYAQYQHPHHSHLRRA